MKKHIFLKLACDNNYLLFLEHDAFNPVITLQNTERGIRLGEVLNVVDVL